MNSSPSQVVTEITNAASDRILTVGTVADEQQDLNAEANLSFDGSTLTVTGNLTVTGTTTTISTTNTLIADKLIEVSNGTTGTPSGDAGIIIERGSSSNAGIIWDESRDEFVVCTTSATGASTGDLTFTPANMSVERLGAGTEQAEAEVHAKRDASSGGTYSTTAPIIIEDDARPAIQLVGSASNIGMIQFGDNAAAAAGQVYYDHGTDKLRIDCGENGDRLTVDASGNVAAAGVVTATGFTIGSAAITETELEILDGATLSTTELNYVDGVSSAIQTQLDAKGPVAGSSSIVTTGALDSGSITSGFGTIDTGSSTITTTGTVSAGDISATGDLTVSGGDALLGTAGNTTATAITTVTNTGTTAGKSLTISAGSTTTGANDINGGDLILATGGGDGTGTAAIVFNTKVSGVDAAAERMRVHTNGYVGVGTSAPLTAIDVVHDYHNATFENILSDGQGGGEVLRYSPGADDSLTAGQLYFLHTDGTWDQTDADAVATGGTQMLGIGLGNARTVGVLIKGFARIPSTEILNVPGSGAVDGLPVYMSTTAGHLDFTAPSGSQDIVRVVGYAIDDDGGDVLIRFDPDSTHIVIA
jgi:hypothetical protein